MCPTAAYPPPPPNAATKTFTPDAISNKLTVL